MEQKKEAEAISLKVYLVKLPYRPIELRKPFQNFFSLSTSALLHPPPRVSHVKSKERLFPVCAQGMAGLWEGHPLTDPTTLSGASVSALSCSKALRWCNQGNRGYGKAGLSPQT